MSMVLNLFDVCMGAIVDEKNKVSKIILLASRSIQTQEDNEYEIITAYVEDHNSMHPDNDLHSGPPSIKVSSWHIYFLTIRFLLVNDMF